MNFLRREGDAWVMATALEVPFELNAVVEWWRGIWNEDNPLVMILRSDPEAETHEWTREGVRTFEASWHTASGGTSTFHQEKEELSESINASRCAVFQYRLRETHVPRDGHQRYRYFDALTRLVEQCGSTRIQATARLRESPSRLNRIPPVGQAFHLRRTVMRDGRRCQKELYIRQKSK